MNIDTLKRKDGTYATAQVSHIKRMMAAGHVTHIQTERGTIAIRPGEHRGNKGWFVDRAVAGITDKDQQRFFKRGEQVRLMRNAIRFLNGVLHSLEAGYDCTVYANQGERDANVLAVKGEQVLVEYEMPAGTSSLVLMAACGNELHRIKTYPHSSLPQHWIDAIHDQGWGSLWIGNGQRTHGTIPLPAHS